MKLNLSRLAQGDEASAQRWQQFLMRGEDQRSNNMNAAVKANTDKLAAMQEAIEQDIEAVNKGIADLKARLQQIVKQAIVLDKSRSAGGMIGAMLEGDEVSRGIPTCTGEVKFSTNAGVPTGWLECDGSYKKCTDYPELYSQIGNQFDVAKPKADNAGWFKLPASADLPGAGAFVWGVWLIRT